MLMNHVVSNKSWAIGNDKNSGHKCQAGLMDFKMFKGQQTVIIEEKEG